MMSCETKENFPGIEKHLEIDHPDLFVLYKRDLQGKILRTNFFTDDFGTLKKMIWNILLDFTIFKLEIYSISFFYVF